MSRVVLREVSSLTTLPPFPDKPIIAVIVKSKSGRDYPFLYSDFDTFYREFYDGRAELMKYKYLFDLDYIVCATRITTTTDNRATLRLSTKQNKKGVENKYLFSNPPYNLKDLKIEGVDGKESYEKGYEYLPEELGIKSNVLRLDYKDLTSIDPKNDYLLIPTKLKVGSKVSNEVLLITFYNSTVSIIGSEKFSANYLREKVNIEGTNEQIREEIQDVLQKYGYEVIEEDNSDVFYRHDLLEKLSISNCSQIKMTQTEEDKHMVISSFNYEERVIEFYSRISGVFGARLSIKIEGNYFTLFLDRDEDKILERYYFTDLLSLFETIDQDSYYLDCELFDSTAEIEEGVWNLGGLESEVDEITVDDYLETIDLFDDEFLSLDYLSFESELDSGHRILDRLNELSKEKKFIVMLDMGNKKHTFTNTPNIFYTSGGYYFEGIYYPSSYRFLEFINKKYTGVIEEKIFIPELLDKDEDYYDDLLRLGLNHIRFDGFRYWINYIYSNDSSNFIYKFMINKVRRELERLDDYLGVTPLELYNTIENIITNLRNNLYLLDSAEITGFEYEPDQGEAIINITISTKEIIKDKIDLRVILKQR